MLPEKSLTPVGVIVLERHGKVKTWLKYPIREQGRYPLTDQARQDARTVGVKLVQYLREKGVLKHFRDNGVKMHLAPTPFVRAVETAEETAGGIEAELESIGIPLSKAGNHLRPVTSLAFIKTSPLPHYPKEGSSNDKRGKSREARWAEGQAVGGWEPLSRVRSRTRTPVWLRKMNTPKDQPAPAGDSSSNSREPLRLYGWVSHGPFRNPKKLRRGVSPIGHALSQLLTPAERKQFGIPVEIARGEMVAVVLYSDGSIHAKHLSA